MRSSQSVFPLGRRLMRSRPRSAVGNVSTSARSFKPIPGQTLTSSSARVATGCRVSPTDVGTTARLSVHARDLLEAAVPGGLGWRAVERLSKAHDASPYVLIPEGGATPPGLDEPAALMRPCREGGVPLTFRSGGTSLSGQAGSEHVLVDTRRHF